MFNKMVIPTNGVGGGKADLLWSNPNPTSSYSGGNVTVNNIDNYDYFILVVLPTINETSTEYFDIFSTSTLSNSSTGVLYSQGYTYLCARKFTKSGNVITFESTSYLIRVDGSYHWENSNYAVPQRIYGIKIDDISNS